MKDILDSNLIVEVISSLTSAIAVFIAFYFFKRKKDADKHLINLIKSEEEFLKKQLVELEVTKMQLQKKMEEEKAMMLKEAHDKLTTISVIQLKLAEEFLNKKMELMKYDLLKNNLEHLASKLSNNDREEILNALQQSSLAGQVNYINRLLELSGSSQTSMLKVADKDELKTTQ